MPYKCKCGWTSRGGVEDLLGHLRGKHHVDVNLSSSHKWIPAGDGLPYFAHCVNCDQYFGDQEAVLEHVGDVHNVNVKLQRKKR
mmetsp:Transcript_137804/g.274793  ORF Transcript_137804/g.274793 Transcript_137804/m.274793 type:complete len:84 (-) Transcript_137804:156-407(-)